MSYVDGFIVAVPRGNVDAYKEFSAYAGSIWKEYGALEYVECLGNDVPYGELTSFPRAVMAKDDEVVVDHAAGTVTVTKAADMPAGVQSKLAGEKV